MLNIGRAGERERTRDIHFLLFFIEGGKKSFSFSLPIVGPVLSRCAREEENDNDDDERFLPSLPYAMARSVVCFNELQDSYMLHVLGPNQWRNPRPMST